MLTLNEAAAGCAVGRKSGRYGRHPILRYHGTRKKFDPKDIDRIVAHLRELEAAKLGPSVKSKACLVGPMSRIGGGYDELVKMREAQKRPQPAGPPSAPSCWPSLPSAASYGLLSIGSRYRNAGSGCQRQNARRRTDLRIHHFGGGRARHNKHRLNRHDREARLSLSLS